MSSSSRRERHYSFNIWPGFVDALATLLMVIIFVLLVFVVAQFYLSHELSFRNKAVENLNTQLSKLTSLLQKERQAHHNLTQDLTKTRHKLTQTEQRLLDVQNARSHLNNRLKELNLALGQEKTTSTELKQQLQELRLHLEALNDRLEEEDVELEAYILKNEKLEDRLAAFKSRLRKAKQATEIAHYRSEFFERLRKALGDRADIRIVGDRFIFQSEVLFETASADLEEKGKKQLDQLVITLKEIASKIPDELNWILRVDGHTDERPIRTPHFSSNWELSTARAISVVKYLLQQGVPPKRLAAAGFGEFQPLETGKDNPNLYRNRRIELKLDQR